MQKRQATDREEKLKRVGAILSKRDRSPGYLISYERLIKVRGDAGENLKGWHEEVIGLENRYNDKKPNVPPLVTIDYTKSLFLYTHKFV